MGRIIFVYLMYLMVPVQSQSSTPNPTLLSNNLFEIVVLALLSAAVILSITSVLGIVLLTMRLRKIWKKLIEKDTIYERVTFHGTHELWDTNGSQPEKVDIGPIDSAAPTRQSSLKLDVNETQRPSSQVSPASRVPSFQSQSSVPSLFKHYTPPDYEDTLSSRERTSRVSQDKSQETWSGVDLSSDYAAWSPYVDMRTCRESLENLKRKDNEGVYDTPRYSAGACICAKRGSACECMASSLSSTLRRAKHSRYFSDSSKDHMSAAFPDHFEPGRLGFRELKAKTSTTLSRDSGVSVISVQSLPQREDEWEGTSGLSESPEEELPAATNSSSSTRQKRKHQKQQPIEI
ncbi:uncharacterized protein LOC136764208 [Amia ocellicauda]|uniref:uncharacterized protein LOC136764208 n=1 Tax=Amia ocellicauda TaxID=2972642 RepID=UPI0034646ED2